MMPTLQSQTADESLRLREWQRLEEKRAAIAEICRRYGVARLSLFGSLTRAGEFGPDSDLDFLVEFLPGVRHGLSFISMELELEDLLGRKVDLNTRGWLSRHFCDEVVREAEVFYAAP